MQTNTIDYFDTDVALQGYYVVPEGAGPFPLVLVAHDWSGQNAFAKEKAHQLAELGYMGFAIDMYGKGVVGQTNDEKMALLQPFVDDRSALQRRVNLGLKTALSIANVDSTKVGAIGFCFGGMCVLDLARTGANVNGVVSFHGLLVQPDNISSPKVKAKVLALHGHDDPMVPPEQVLGFETEMTEAAADWQLVAYGNTSHAFMNQDANDTELGTVYNARTESRAWCAMQCFFKEIF